ncbi:hypothetical protein LA080_007380 [Diaporthe eres]|nr:hypothetical protein LA080_007380 [Diaporthe eres]
MYGLFHINRDTSKDSLEMTDHRLEIGNTCPGKTVRGGSGSVRAKKPLCGTPITAPPPAALGFGGAAGVACRHGSAQEWLLRIAGVRGPPIHNQVLGYASRARGSMWWHGGIASRGRSGAGGGRLGWERLDTLAAQEAHMAPCNSHMQAASHLVAAARA